MGQTVQWTKIRDKRKIGAPVLRLELVRNFDVVRFQWLSLGLGHTGKRFGELRFSLLDDLGQSPMRCGRCVFIPSWDTWCTCGGDFGILEALIENLGHYRLGMCVDIESSDDGRDAVTGHLKRGGQELNKRTKMLD